MRNVTRRSIISSLMITFQIKLVVIKRRAKAWVSKIMIAKRCSGK